MDITMPTKMIVQFHELIHKMLPTVWAVLISLAAVLVKAGRKKKPALITIWPLPPSKLDHGIQVSPQRWILPLSKETTNVCCMSTYRELGPALYRCCTQFIFIHNCTKKESDSHSLWLSCDPLKGEHHFFFF